MRVRLHFVDENFIKIGTWTIGKNQFLELMNFGDLIRVNNILCRIEIIDPKVTSDVLIQCRRTINDTTQNHVD